MLFTYLTNFLFCLLISALFVTHLTPIWERFQSGCPSDSITWYFPGCWFWAQAGVLVVMPLHLNRALAAAHPVLQKGSIHMTPIHSLGKAKQALSPWADTVSHHDLEGSFSDSALGWQIRKLLWDLFLCKYTDMTHYTNVVMCENSRGKYNPKPPS